MIEQGDSGVYAEFLAWKAAQAAGSAALGLAPAAPLAPLKLDLGCGSTVRREHSQRPKGSGWTGVDLPGAEGADVACDLATERWPWADASVDEVQCSHMLEHVPRLQRIHFFNELYRVLKPGAKAYIVTPHWGSERAYGDLTHEWPPVTPFSYAYLNADWRKLNAPHIGFTCNFSYGCGASPAPHLAGRNDKFVLDAVRDNLNAADDLQATLVKL